MSFRPAQPRGGPQIIPRPAQWRLGGPAPWAHLTDRSLSLSQVVDALAGQNGFAVPNLPVVDHRPAGVLVALYEEQGEAHVVLTRRSPHMASHPHQVSFPGGRQDVEDADLWVTACREAHEEVALDPILPRLVGELPPMTTIGRPSLIHPFVAVLPERPTLVANPAEVEAIRHVALAELLSDEVWREEHWQRDGQEVAITFFELPGDTIWGVTGTLLRQLLTLGLGLSLH